MTLHRRRRDVDRHHARARPAARPARQDRRRGVARAGGRARLGPRLGAGRGGGRRAVPLRRRRAELGAVVGVLGAAHAALVLHARHRRSARSGHGVRPELPALEVDRRRPELPAGPHAARRRPRALDRSEGSAAHDRGQRRRRLRVVHRRPVVVLDPHAAHGAALPRDHRRPLPLPRLRVPAGQHGDQHPEPIGDRRDHGAGLDQAGRRRERLHRDQAGRAGLRGGIGPDRAALHQTSCISTTTGPSRTGRTRSGPSSTAGERARRRSGTASTEPPRSTGAVTTHGCSGSARSTCIAPPTWGRAGRC